MRAWYFLVVVVVIVACGPAVEGSRVQPPRSPEAGLQPGDTLRLFVDDWLEGEVVIDAAGTVSFPMCRAAVLAGRTEITARDEIARCLIESGAYRELPAVIVSVVAGPEFRLVVGRGHRTRVAPLEPGITVISALASGLVSERPPPSVTLRRHGTSYAIDVDAILAGNRPDQPLERGDEIAIGKEVRLRPTPTVRSLRPIRVELPLLTTTCGGLFLEEQWLRSSSLGGEHPHWLAVRAAMTERCTPEATRASLVAACLAVRLEHMRLQSELGPAHPTMRKLATQLGQCPVADAPTLPARPDDAACQSLRAQRDALAGEGLGPRHPAVVQVMVRLSDCP